MAKNGKGAGDAVEWCMQLSSSKLHESYEIRRSCIFIIQVKRVILGIVEVLKEYYHVYNSKFGLVNVKFLKPLSNQVTLNSIKQNPLLKNMVILKQSRLSVSPVLETEWNEIIRMSEC